jgi:hypothetical protein
MIGVGMIVRACHRATFRENCSLRKVHNTVIADQPGSGTFGTFGILSWRSLTLAKESSHGGNGRQGKGRATNEAIGKAKQGVGEAVG